MTGEHAHVLLAVQWRTEPPPSLAGWAAEVVLPDQSALDRAGLRGLTPPPFDALFWRAEVPPGLLADLVDAELAPHVDRWVALRLLERPAWDDTVTLGVRPTVKQVAFVKARADLAPGAFVRHFREHVDVARVHHPAICRYAQHDVLEAAGDPPLDVDGVSELWFADEESLVARYYAGLGSVDIVRADNREYIDFRGTLSLLVRPVERRDRTATGDGH